MRARWFLTFLLLPSLTNAGSLTLEQAESSAKTHSPALRQSLAARDQARDRQRAALAAFLPKLNLSAGLSDGGGYAPASGELTGGGNPGTSLGLNASQSLFRGGADWQALQQAQNSLAAAEEDLRLARAKAAYDVRNAWASALYAQAQVAQAVDTAKRRQANVDLVQLRFDAGRENKGALLQTQAQALQAEADARKAQRGLNAALRSLGRAMGEDPAAGTTVVGDLPVPGAPLEGDSGRLAAELPAVRKAVLALKNADSALAADWADALPSLNASGGLNRNGKDWLPENGSWSVGLSLSWNLFNGFSDWNGRNADKAQRLAAEAALEDARRQASQGLDASREDLLNSLDQLAVGDAFLKAGEARADIAQAQYAQGLIGFEDWDRIESDLISTRQQSLSNRRNAAVSGFAWEQAQAKGWEP